MKKTLLIACALVAGGVMAAPAAADNGVAARMLTNFLFQNGDSNDNGRLDPSEIAELRLRAFQRADVDGNGVISAAEQESAAARRARRAEMARFVGDEQLDRFDLDKDGQVSLAEFEAAPRPAFAMVDINGDGALDRAEIDRVVAIISEAR